MEKTVDLKDLGLTMYTPVEIDALLSPFCNGLQTFYEALNIYKNLYLRKDTDILDSHRAYQSKHH
jgi:hypothetical protein